MNNLIIYVSSFHCLHTHTHGNFIPIFIQDILKDNLEKIFHFHEKYKIREIEFHVLFLSIYSKKTLNRNTQGVMFQFQCSGYFFQH